MVDFSTLLSRPAGEAKKPEPLPKGLYPGRTVSREFGESAQKKTPFVRFGLRVTGWPENFEIPDEHMGTDLSKRTLRTEFYFTDDALWRLDEFLASCGIQLAGRPYDECIMEALNCEVLMEINQELNQQTNEIYNKVGKITGTAG